MPALEGGLLHPGGGVEVADGGAGVMEGCPASPAGPPGKVGVFQVAEEALIEEAGVGQQAGAIEGGTGGGTEDRLDAPSYQGGAGQAEAPVEGHAVLVYRNAGGGHKMWEVLKKHCRGYH